MSSRLAVFLPPAYFNRMSVHFTCPLATIASLEILGGKGLSLGQLTSAGFAVPNGFHLTTAAYREFINVNDLQQRLNDLAKPEFRDGRLSFESASEQIAALFAAGSIPQEVRDAVDIAYAQLAPGPVAVRSSATAEDLPDLSFAGQQDTYLHVNGVDALLSAILNCWTSLWGARALSYRHQMGIAQDQISMAVVIQQMVPAEVSGVLFTANPASGARDEVIINASYGLGEAIVSGEVTPDSFTLDRRTGDVQAAEIGAKVQMVVADELQGTRFADVGDNDRARASLDVDQLNALFQLAEKVEAHFRHVPQDIEWLIAEGKLWLLQSRPITNLPPPPLTDIVWQAPEPSAYLGRSQLVEHIPDPVSPMFEDLHMKSSLQHYWGMNLVANGGYDYVDTQPPASFFVQTTLNGYAYRQLGPPPRTGYPAGQKRDLPFKNPLLSSGVQKRLAWLKAKWRHYRTWLLWIPQWRYVSLPAYLREVARWAAVDPTTATTEQLRSGIRAMSLADARYWYSGGVWNAFSLTRGTESLLHDFLQQYGEGRFSTGQFLSGLKSPAFEAHVALWRVARLIQKNQQLYDAAVTAAPALLLDVLRDHPLGSDASQAIQDYFAKNGHQVFSLDFAEPCEAEAPENIARSLHAMILQQGYDPVENQKRLATQRRALIREASAYFKGEQRRRFRKLLWQARYYYPNREEAMFHMGKAWTVLRPMARELGQRLTDVGTLNEADDVYFLTMAELGRSIRALLVGDSLPEYLNCTTERRQLREARRFLSPPTHVGKAPYWLKSAVAEEDEVDQHGDHLAGSAVSPGQVTAPVSLIMSPADFSKMKPNTILVCPTTTPAWTQLFPQAVGLVTDIGGILAHGSIVAREYGIPAVLGLGNATQRIVDGQTITIDGNNGIVTLMSDDAEASSDN
jgi:rifampicin phosphotransferase